MTVPAEWIIEAAMSIKENNIKRERKNRIVFLDIDGVLNTLRWDAVIDSHHMHFDKVQLLNRICLEGDANVVIHSAWTKNLDVNIIASILWSHGFDIENIGILGTTPKKLTSTRYHELPMYFDDPKNGPIDAWVILDDWDLRWDEKHLSHPMFKNSIKTDPGIGLTEELATQAVLMLNK